VLQVEAAHPRPSRVAEHVAKIVEIMGRTGDEIKAGDIAVLMLPGVGCERDGVGIEAG
jgi:hypothetical protein